MKVAEALTLTRGDEVRAIKPHPMEGKVYRVTVHNYDKDEMLRVCTHKGIAFYPEHIERVEEPEAAEGKAEADGEEVAA